VRIIWLLSISLHRIALMFRSIAAQYSRAGWFSMLIGALEKHGGGELRRRWRHQRLGLGTAGGNERCARTRGSILVCANLRHIGCRRGAARRKYLCSPSLLPQRRGGVTGRA